VRTAFTNGVPAVESSFLRIWLIAVVFAIAAVLNGSSFVIPRAGWLSFAGLCFSTFVISISYLVAVEFIPVALTVIIFFTFPVIILLVAPIVEGHSPGLARIAIALFAFAGLGIAIGPGFGSLDIRGIALAVVASLAATLQFYSGRAISRHVDPVTFGSLVHMAIWPLSLLVVLWQGGGDIRFLHAGVTQTGYLCTLALSIAYVGAYFFHMQSLKFAPASIVAPFFNLEPIITIAIAALVLGENLALNHYAGGAMVIAALLASSLLAFAPRREADAGPATSYMSGL
jgi:drug/metabolite transporter (DMT)-like permease